LPDSTDFSDVVYDVVTAGSWNFVKFFDALSKKYPAELPKLPSLSPDADKISDSGFKTAGPFTIQ
jgi:hypothetical protein